MSHIISEHWDRELASHAKWPHGDHRMNHIVVYGGQYGSEGKASAAEYWAKRLKAENPRKVLFVMGENGPNSGHTSSKGVTKNIPASSFWADYVLMGPDTVVDPEALNKDWKAVNRPIFIHEHAALLSLAMKAEEADLVKRISSTGSGTGAARAWKFFHAPAKRRRAGRAPLHPQ